MGTIAHRLLEHALSVQAADLSVLWDQLVNETEERMMQHDIDRRFVPLVNFVPDLLVLRAKTIMRAEEIVDQKSVRSERGTGLPRVGGEVRVKSRGGHITGRIDRATQTKGGIVLQDYKTGPFTVREGSETEIRPEYRQQLLLYAALYYETVGVWPIRLELVPLVGASTAVPFNSTECKTLLDAAEKSVHEVNDVLAEISTESQGAEERLARPSPKVCKFCQYRPACSAYLTTDRSQDDDWPADVCGTLRSVTTLGNGGLALGVELMSGETVYIRDIVHAASGLAVNIEGLIGRSIGIFSTRRCKSSKAFDAGPYTTIFVAP